MHRDGHAVNVLPRDGVRRWLIDAYDRPVVRVRLMVGVLLLLVAGAWLAFETTHREYEAPCFATISDVPASQQTYVRDPFDGFVYGAPNCSDASRINSE